MKNISIAFSLICGGGGLLGALAIWAYQIYMFLRYGQWASYSLVDFGIWVCDCQWLSFPNEWLGVHRIMSWSNGGFGLLVIGLLLSALAASTRDGI